MNTIRLLQFVVLVFGVKELCNAMAYHKQQKKKWAIASLCMGIFTSYLAFHFKFIKSLYNKGKYAIMK